MKKTKITAIVALAITVSVSALLIVFHSAANGKPTVNQKRNTLNSVNMAKKERKVPTDKPKDMQKNKLSGISMNKERNMPVLLHNLSSKRGIPILLYHHILKRSENTFTRDPAVINLEAFEEQMKYLYDLKYHIATMAELESYLHGGEVPNKTVVISFDDGLKTNYIYAYPILKKYNFRAINFLITGRLAQKPVPFQPEKLQYLSWPEVDAMRDVFEYGSHTNALHDKVLGFPGLIAEPDQVILNDLTISKNLLKTNFFAYPFGAFNDRAIRLLKLAGYQYAFTTIPVDARFGDNPYTIGRIAIYPNTDLDQFIKIVQTIK
ncbi:polysaccharide deacetylase family protein [Bacillus sp. BRMEA1]|uniref:polysaccharide deacetylase family protein n=1 Tax=Neobacillus endophyticus TaxID=2738405 RepID=UPI001567471C|nr:polysaccharide deacetylase family protein [Neobacillus endophyticus]NRD77084.1 polysaccharide deacetylase family protein [Neobacillus endophyticus]